MRLQTCEKVMGLCTAQSKRLLFGHHNIFTYFDLAHLKKKLFCDFLFQFQCFIVPVQVWLEKVEGVDYTDLLIRIGLVKGTKCTESYLMKAVTLLL